AQERDLRRRRLAQVARSAVEPTQQLPLQRDQVVVAPLLGAGERTVGTHVDQGLDLMPHHLEAGEGFGGLWVQRDLLSTLPRSVALRSGKRRERPARYASGTKPWAAAESSP